MEEWARDGHSIKDDLPEAIDRIAFLMLDERFIHLLTQLSWWKAYCSKVSAGKMPKFQHT